MFENNKSATPKAKDTFQIELLASNLNIWLG